MSEQGLKPDDNSDARCLLLTIETAIDGALSRLLGRHDPDLDDLRQTALEAALYALTRGQFRGDCSLTGWVKTIARNIVNDALRERIRARRLFGSAIDLAGDDESDIPDLGRAQCLSEACHDLAQVDLVLAGLDSTTARVVYLHDALGYDLPELAPMLGMSTSAAQSRLVRARKRIVGALSGGHARGGIRAGRVLKPASPSEARPARERP